MVGSIAVISLALYSCVKAHMLSALSQMERCWIYEAAVHSFGNLAQSQLEMMNHCISDSTLSIPSP